MTSPESRCFILTDASNLFYRQIKMTSPAADIDSKIGIALHMILQSTKKEFRKWNGDHLVFFMEGHCWRKKVYKGYKADRKVLFAKQSKQDQEEHTQMVTAFDDFVGYLRDKTNVTVVRNEHAEADDMIYNWILAHPNDQHILISSDSDFFQLLRFPNVMLYDPVKNIQIRQDSVCDDNGNKLSFTVTSTAKIKVGPADPDFVCEKEWYNYAVFLKCIRGDKTDNIFSAFPGVREKGSRTSVGIRDAYEDRVNKGYDWNNFMLNKFQHHDGTEHLVRDDYEFNEMLIVFDHIPADIKAGCQQSITEAIVDKNITAVDLGHQFMRFCNKWELIKISENSKDFMPMLKSKYNK